MKNIIEVENLGKKYILRHQQQEPYTTLRDTISQGAKTIGTKLVHPKRVTPITREEFWAVKDVSFTIAQGDRLGIIGRNGAGKSTLLKILSRITEPTQGRIKLKGRVASLLEVGTGFHPELTGRENIFLNGAILGMSREEIRQKFDEIVAFAEVEKFLDTPVKRYSSGMYVRLAFAVAAHLEPEILIVDEVLAVGDAQFQKKCLGKMKDVGKEGRTVLFVSHNMASINELCSKCLLLEGGKAITLGETSKVISTYLSKDYGKSDGRIDLTAPELRKNSREESLFKFTELSVNNSQGKTTTSIELMEPFSLAISGRIQKPIEEVSIGFSVMSSLGFPVFNSFVTEKDLPPKGQGNVDFKIHFDPNLFGPGLYTIGLGANGKGVIDWIPEVITIRVEQFSSHKGKSVAPNYDGVVLYPCKWVVEPSKKDKD